MSQDVFNPKAHSLLVKHEDARMKERPAPATLKALQARFGADITVKGHYKDPAKMALGHNKSRGPRRQ